MALSLADDMVKDLLTLPHTHRLTITYDQGSEFAWWEDMEKQLEGTKDSPRFPPFFLHCFQYI